MKEIHEYYFNDCFDKTSVDYFKNRNVIYCKNITMIDQKYIQEPLAFSEAMILNKCLKDPDAPKDIQLFVYIDGSFYVGCKITADNISTIAQWINEKIIETKGVSYIKLPGFITDGYIGDYLIKNVNNSSVGVYTPAYFKRAFRVVMEITE